MLTNKFMFAMLMMLLIGLGGCSRQQSDWQKSREANTTDAYEQFVKKYPSGEFAAQAQARLKEMYEERDWQKARDTDTADAYQAFLKQYPEGKWTEEARIRVENFTLAQTPGPGAAAGAPGGATGSVSPSAAATSSIPPGPPSSAATAAAPTMQKPKPNPAPTAQAPSAEAPSGTYAVQLGAFKSGTAAADKRWEHLRKEYPKLLAGLSSKVVPKKTAGGTLYRLQAVGMSESHARSICKNLKAKSQPCVIVGPVHT